MLDDGKQSEYEIAHLDALKIMLKALYLKKLRGRIAALERERESINSAEEHSADGFQRILQINADISRLKKKVESYKPFFDEPYFARMDVTDKIEGYNSYYIGKHGDEGLEIVDWRAPLAHKYYQKSRTRFTINDYDYKLILRRALRTASGKLLEFKNEFLDLNDYLSKEEIGDRGETLIFDPFLKEILQSRKEKREICDIIETIQERQFEIITLPERDEFALSGVAGSGKTMILLHRLSYIMYNDESVKPSDVLIITPSDSFNDFIDELATILELERVKTSTIDAYFCRMLNSVGVDLTGRVDYSLKLPPEYASFIYSFAFVSEVEDRLLKIFDGVYGLFSSPESREFLRDIDENCREQIADYDKIKNASLRIRRCVLGEIKEKEGGGLYYTKQFRYLFNGVASVMEFFDLVERDVRMKGYAFFYRQLLTFYKAIKFVRKNSSKVCLTALRDLKNLKEAIEREISELGRYRQRGISEEVLTYASQIEKKKGLVLEIDATICRVESIFSRFSAMCDLFDVIHGDSYLTKIGKCEDVADILRLFNREILKKIKKRFGADAKSLYKCDPFALCMILIKLGYRLTPQYAYVFVDEAQDISAAEYSILREVNSRATFNVFGDLKQNITPYRGLRSWADLGLNTYELDVNYRNTNQIVEFVADGLGIDMRSIGLGGQDVERVPRRNVTGWLSAKNGLKAIICSAENIGALSKKSYNILSQTGKISKTKINLMTVYESKGLEFTAVAVLDGDLTDNEKYVAYTRALRELAIIT